MPDRQPVAIVGGSIAGLATALALRRAGRPVEVFERSAAPLESRGAGIVTHPELLEALGTLGIPPGRLAGVPIRGRRAVDRAGEPLAACDLPQLVTSWDVVWRLLRGQIPEEVYRAGRRLTAVAIGEGDVEAVFADGSRPRFAWLVGADGLRSAVRAHAFPDARPEYAGYVAWRGIVPEAEVPPSTRAVFAEHMVFCLVPGEQILVYPVAGAGGGTRPGERRLNFVWYRPADPEAGLRELLTDRDGRFDPFGIAPDGIREEVAARMRADAARLLAPPFADLVARTARPMLQPIYDLVSPGMVRGRLALVGDAAFVARPHTGMGVTKAALDAVALGRAFAADPPDLALLERERLSANRTLVERGRALGRYFERARTAAADPTAFRELARTVVRETAVPPPA